MPIVKFVPLQSPQLDPRNEEDLVQYSMDRVFTASNGTINDFSIGSPTRALLEGGCFAQAEFLYYLNQLPESIAIEFLKIMGIQQKLGSAAQVPVTFTLTISLTNPFYIPAGFQVNTGDGISFTTDTQLVIPAGQIQGSVSATCTQVGTIGNVAAYSIKQLSQPLAYLQGVANLQAASGGTADETIEEVKTRAFQAIRQRGLVSADDYEQRAIAVLGSGATAKAIGNLAKDKISYERGSVHAFCLNPDGSSLNDAQIISLQNDLQSKTVLGANCYVSSADKVKIAATLIASLIDGANPQTTADLMYAAINDYLTPGKLPFGEAIVLKELEYTARLAGASGIDYLQQLTIGISGQSQFTTNLALPYAYSVGILDALVIELVPSSGSSFFYAYGSGDPD